MERAGVSYARLRGPAAFPLNSLGAGDVWLSQINGFKIVALGDAQLPCCELGKDGGLRRGVFHGAYEGESCMHWLREGFGASQ